MSGKSHSVDHLDLHLQDQYNVVFALGAERETVDAAKSRDSKLSACLAPFRPILKKKVWATPQFPSFALISKVLLPFPKLCLIISA